MTHHIVKDLDYEKLKLLKEDLESGKIAQAIEERMSMFENPNRVCPVCSTPLEPQDAITLYFGPKELRQKASFDGEDCLQFFVAQKGKWK